MPYKIDGSDVPASVKKMPARKRRQWIRIWNSVFAKCRKDGGQDCEGAAFRQANGAIKR